MTWFKVDDSFYDSPKVADLETGACFEESLALWLLAGSWCARHLTDGKISDAQVRKFCRKKRAPEELVRVRLWERVEGGYQFHNWLKWQPSKEKVEARREKTRTKVAAHRNKEGNEVCNQVTCSSSNPSPDPTRPVPSYTHAESPPALPGKQEPATALSSRAQLRFRKLHLDRFKADPGMGGKNIGTFGPRLASTAEARGVDPLALLETAFAGWADEGRPGIDRAGEFSAFVARFNDFLPEVAAKPEQESERGFW